MDFQMIHPRRILSRLRRTIPVRNIVLLPVPARERLASNHAADLRRRWPEEPTLEHPVSQLCTIHQFRQPYQELCRSFGEIPRVHRKQWEFAYILQALRQSGALQNKARGLGFAVGREPLPSCFAAHGCEIVATDMAAEQAHKWARTNQYGGNIQAIWRPELINWDDFERKVSFRVADMREVPTDLSKFDFCWSSCALEHLGNLTTGLNFIKRSLYCLKPGGIAIHTTEFNLKSNYRTEETGDTVIYRENDILKLTDELQRKGFKIDLNLNPGSHVLDDYIDTVDDAELHTRCNNHNKITSTSIGLIIRKCA